MSATCLARDSDKKKRPIRDVFFAQMAGRTGLEPATSGVTGRRYNQLNYRPIWAPPFRRVSELLAILALTRQ